jgi:hypothetical protein
MKQVETCPKSLRSVYDLSMMKCFISASLVARHLSDFEWEAQEFQMVLNARAVFLCSNIDDITKQAIMGIRMQYVLKCVSRFIPSSRFLGP